MKRSLLLLALCSACTDDSSGGGGPGGTAHIESYFLPAQSPPKIDVLFVIDDTTAMASHQQALLAMPMQLEQIIEGSYGNAGSYHFGVVTTDAATSGNLRTSTEFQGTYVVYDNSFTGQMNNFSGTLANALRSVFPSSASSTAANQPFATMRAALDNNVTNAGFLRSDAYLGIVTVSATDDASLDAAMSYASFLKALKTDPASVIVSGVFDPTAARLSAFHDQFPNRSFEAPIASTDYSGALEVFAQLYRTVLGYACNKEPADADLETPGAQYDCSFVWVEAGVEHLLPQCKGGDTSGCWEIVVADPQICVDPTTRAHLQTRGFTTSPSTFGDPFHPEVRGQCLVN